MQLLLLLAYTTLPWPVDLSDSGIYGDSDYAGSTLHVISSQYARVEDMPGHPQAPPGAAEAMAAERKKWGRQAISKGVPGADVDNQCTGDDFSSFVDGLAVGTKTSKAFKAFMAEKLALVTQFHRGQR